MKMLKLYYYFALVAAVIGLIQFFAFLVGLQPIYDLSWLGLRVMNPTTLGSILVYPVHSITDEPAGFAFVEAAAMHIALGTLLNTGSLKLGTKIQASIILLAFLLSFSSTGYVIIFISLLLHYVNKINFKRIVLFFILSSFSLFSLYEFVPKFKERLDTSLGLILGNIVVDTYAQDQESANGSAIILFNHFLIAAENFRNHPFGTGVGSHHLAFERYNRLQTWFTGYGPGGIALNANDGCSLFNRLLSELGILGLGGIALFLFRYYLKNGPPDLLLANHASLVVILAALLRSGHYFIYGLPFFFFLYYYSAIFNNPSKSVFPFPFYSVDSASKPKVID
ncbi:hypothetical protein [Persicitalea jodogahamensis]|uniref:hypothetical protein n=1 Tax=Persicitalea jodogahamensis TaxID=402147 RepID=UPI00167BB147|nr:hypothetical protein [Persicitalea jodogahamensis]